MGGGERERERDRESGGVDKERVKKTEIWKMKENQNDSTASKIISSEMLSKKRNFENWTLGENENRMLEISEIFNIYLKLGSDIDIAMNLLTWLREI